MTTDIGAIAARGKKAATTIESAAEHGLDVGKLAVGGLVGLTLAAFGARSARLVGRAIAGAIAGAVAGVLMNRIARKPASYAVASGTGTMYELLHDVPGVTLGRGALFGAAIWLGADEPPFGARAVAAHVAYGVTLDTMLRVARAAFG